MKQRQQPETTREGLVSHTFLQLADTLVDDFDIIDLLTILADRCLELVDADAAGILLVDSDGNLRVMAASSEQARLLELFQLQNEEGPCLEAYSSGQAVINTDLRVALEQWPRFTPYAVSAGFESAYALPLRLRGTVIGALIFGVIISGFTFLRLDAYYQEMVKGVIIVGAVVLDQWRQRRQAIGG